jgi:hypothetical protein
MYAYDERKKILVENLELEDEGREKGGLGFQT